MRKTGPRAFGVTFFYMDIRPMGKDYERYYERAKNEYGIEYRRCAISSIKELQRTKNLLITYVKEDGTFEEKEFDAVVLSLGFTPPQTVKDLAERMGLQVESARDSARQMNSLLPRRRSKGFSWEALSGAPEIFRKPSWKDQARRQRPHPFSSPIRLPQQARAYPLEGALGEEIPRIGVFLCHCGEELKKSLSISDLCKGQRQLREVAHVEEIGWPAFRKIWISSRERIGEQGLNRIVIAGCSHREIRRAMEEMAKGMGFNPYLIEYANITGTVRLCPSRIIPGLATEKAMALIRMAVERARRIQPIRRGKQQDREEGTGRGRRPHRHDGFPPSGGAGI